MREKCSALSIGACFLVVVIDVAPAVANSKRELAGRSYADGERQVLSGNFAKAAQLFERADELIPTPQALRSAARCRMAAGHELVALAQAEQLMMRYPDDIRSRALADETFELLRPRFVRVEATCSSRCRLHVDQKQVSRKAGIVHVFYVSPGDHEVVATFSNTQQTRYKIAQPAGSSVSLALRRAIRERNISSDFSKQRDSDSAIQQAVHSMDRRGTDARKEESPKPTAAAPPGPSNQLDQSGSLDLRARAHTPVHYNALALGGASTAAMGMAAFLCHRSALAAEATYIRNSTQENFATMVRRRERTRMLLGAAGVSAAVTVGIAVIDARLRQETNQRRLAVSFTSDSAVVQMNGEF